MRDFTLPELLGLDLPHFLDTKTVCLGLAVPSEVIFLDNLFRQAAMTALTEQSDAGMELHSPLKRILRLAVTPNAEIIRCDTNDGAFSVVENLTCSKSGVHLHTQFFCALPKPLAQLAQADDVVALVTHLRRMGDRDGVFFSQEAHLVRCRGGNMLEPGGIVLREPVWEQFVHGRRLNHVSGHNVVANLPRLLQQQDAKVLVSGFVCELLQPNSGSQTGGTFKPCY